jgi:hypothetical protein
MPFHSCLPTVRRRGNPNTARHEESFGHLSGDCVTSRQCMSAVLQVPGEKISIVHVRLRVLYVGCLIYNSLVSFAAVIDTCMHMRSCCCYSVE